MKKVITYYSLFLSSPLPIKKEIYKERKRVSPPLSFSRLEE